MKRLSEGPDLPQPGPRYASQILHDEPNVRVIGFHLREGQKVPPHQSPSTVIVQVTEGVGVFTGGEAEERLSAGMSAVYSPGEIHSISAIEGPLRFRAVISPRPG